MSAVDIATIEAHLQLIPIGLRYIDLYWGRALQENDLHRWITVSAFLLGGRAALGFDHPDIDDYRTLTDLVNQYIDDVILERRSA